MTTTKAILLSAVLLCGCRKRQDLWYIAPHESIRMTATIPGWDIQPASVIISNTSDKRLTITVPRGIEFRYDKREYATSGTIDFKNHPPTKWYDTSHWEDGMEVIQVPITNNPTRIWIVPTNQTEIESVIATNEDGLLYWKAVSTNQTK